MRSNEGGEDPLNQRACSGVTHDGDLRLCFSGTGIYAEFKYGSAKSARENLQLPQLQLLGLSLVDLQSQSELDRHKLPLDQCDRTRLNNLLSSDVGRNDFAIRSVSHVLRRQRSDKL
jgi:DNA topoisomerase VI subunit A